MSDQAERMTEGQESFLGEVSHPSLLPTSLPRIGGLIEFMVHPLHRRGRIEAGSPVQLMSVSGHVYPAIIRGWGFLAPNYSRPPRWQIGDFSHCDRRDYPGSSPRGNASKMGGSLSTRG